MTEITLMKQQVECSDFWTRQPRMFNNGDPGTGKTISSLAGWRKSMKGRLLVIAPLTILRPSWASDIDSYLPGFTWAVAHGTRAKRQAAFDSGADIVLINHDGVNWLAENLAVLEGFSHCVIDEYTAYKNRTTDRSKAAMKVAKAIEAISLLSGTPNSNKITDLWFPAMLVDGGQRLGNSFYKFQQQVCTGEDVPGAPSPFAKNWVEKEGARDVVVQLLSDITIRHELEACVDIPPNTRHVLQVDMPAAVMKQYRELEKNAYLETEHGAITAIHAGSKAKKILQLLSGAVYNAEGGVVKVHPHRCQLVIDLVQQRDQCVVAFNWKHERDQLTAMADKMGIFYAVIDGDLAGSRRTEKVQQIVDDFQAGKIKVIFAHPQSASHGLTLTSGTTTIWASPTYNAEHFQQLNARIYRKGQEKKTETICIAAAGTKELDVYEKLFDKLTNMNELLSLFASLTAVEHAA